MVQGTHGCGIALAPISLLLENCTDVGQSQGHRFTIER